MKTIRTFYNICFWSENDSSILGYISIIGAVYLLKPRKELSRILSTIIHPTARGNIVLSTGLTDMIFFFYNKWIAVY